MDKTPTLESPIKTPGIKLKEAPYDNPYLISNITPPTPYSKFLKLPPSPKLNSPPKTIKLIDNTEDSVNCKLFEKK
ncbi:hypothetical protein DLAC_06307 [Tieghemostelium lacteum]|uniref:Uncharacterized protein n=1 Tax=Tieghemostelium lacteum TaxID=361077 RepID=A0A151ZEM3_TIELA|nr:hypothetical protein DLAC_06307 [Tieghemostelium lacteum]|eukprot:KYQ92344.1 hypothetical protein DLAC_06307 [Tieghemostelium lacteum]